MQHYVEMEDREKIKHLAEVNNCWIKHGQSWYTPEEYWVWNRNGAGWKPEHIRIMNPISVLQKGNRAIRDMVNRRATPMEITDALSRYGSFIEQIFTNNYRPIPDQPDEVFLDDHYT